MVEPTDINPVNSPDAAIAVPGLSGMLPTDMTPEQHDQVKRLVLAMKVAGVSWNTIAEQWPLLNKSTMQNWWRTARYAPMDTRPGAVEAARQRQAGEVRWLLEQTFDRIAELREREAQDDDRTTARIETDTDRFSKLGMMADRFHRREAALLGLDAPVRMELDQRIKLDWSPELESLVAELAGGGLLQTDAGEILDGEVVE